MSRDPADRATQASRWREAYTELSGLAMAAAKWTGAEIFRSRDGFAHNGGVTIDPQATACPQCGSADSVRSIQELASLAGSSLGQQPGAPQQGWNAEPQQGPPGGWNAQPQAGPPAGPGGMPGGLLGGLRGGRRNWEDQGFGGNPLDNLGDDIAGAAMGLVGRAIGRRMQRAMTEKVLPAVQARQQAALRNQQQLAQRYPDLCACLTDKVIFLAGGSRVAPLASLSGMTPEQADAVVASLRDS